METTLYYHQERCREQLPNLFSQKAQIGGDQESLGAAALSRRGNKREHFSQVNGATCDQGQGEENLNRSTLKLIFFQREGPRSLVCDQVLGTFECQPGSFDRLATWSQTDSKRIRSGHQLYKHFII